MFKNPGWARTGLLIHRNDYSFESPETLKLKGRSVTSSTRTQAYWDTRKRNRFAYWTDRQQLEQNGGI